MSAATPTGGLGSLLPLLAAMGGGAPAAGTQGGIGGNLANLANTFSALSKLTGAFSPQQTSPGSGGLLGLLGASGTQQTAQTQNTGSPQQINIMRLMNDITPYLPPDRSWQFKRMSRVMSLMQEMRTPPPIVEAMATQTKQAQPLGLLQAVMRNIPGAAGGQFSQLGGVMQMMSLFNRSNNSNGLLGALSNLGGVQAAAQPDMLSSLLAMAGGRQVSQAGSANGIIDQLSALLNNTSQQSSSHNAPAYKDTQTPIVESAVPIRSTADLVQLGRMVNDLLSGMDIQKREDLIRAIRDALRT